MTMFAGLDVGFKRTAVCVVDGSGRSVWRGVVDTHPEAIAAALKRWRNGLEKVGLETGSMSPWLARGLGVLGFPVVCMDARRAADAVKSRRVKSDKADAFALAEMLRTGWYSAVHVKSEESHRLKALLGARDQLVRAKRALGNQVRGLLRPFGIRLPSRQGTKKFADSAHQAVAHDAMLSASVTALMEALAAIEGQLARLDDRLKELARRSPVCWRLMSVPGVGPIVALAFMAAIEDVGRFTRMRDIGVYLGLTPKRYQSGETDVGLGISHQGDRMARHYLYEAANVLLTTVRSPSALKSWGLKLVKRRGPKRARVAVARKLAAVLGRIWKDGTHFAAA
jgi:transposase